MLGRFAMRRVLVIAIVAAVLGVAAWAYWYRTSSRVYVPSGSAVSVTVFLLDQPLATITNTAGLAAVTKVLRSGRPVRLLHSCAAAGHFETRFAGGQTLSTAFGPGHEPSRYEFGMDGHLFSTARPEFLGALKAGGVDVQKIPTE
jgi:hypothetical protein